MSFARYGALLHVPDLRAIAVASIIGRLPIGMAGLAILLLMQSTRQSFVDAGLASGCYVAGLALIAPLLGRYIDRHGPRRVLVLSTLLYPICMGLLIVTALGATSRPVLAVVAFTAGASYPPITVCMRALIRQLLTDQAQQQAAYSLESLIIELIFILGPLLVALMVGLAHPGVAVGFAGLCAALGTVLFIRSPALKHWRIESIHTRSLLGPLTTRGFVPLLVVIVFYCAAFGLFEVGVTGYAAEHGQPWLAGVMLGLASVGSASGALAYGARQWHWSLQKQFTVALSAMGAGCVLLSYARDDLSFALLTVLAGLAMSPPLIIQSMLVARIARPEHNTEAFTWSATSLLGGVGLGIAGGGVILETQAASQVFLAAGCMGLLAAACSCVLFLRFLRAT